MLHSTVRAAALSLVALAATAACGKPMDPSGKEDNFVHASMVGKQAPTEADRPLASDLAVEPVSMLVMFNRLKTPEALQDALNKKPGQFSHLDIDKDMNPDPLTVAAREAKQGHAFEIRARPTSGEFVVATMIFDPEWSFLGYYNGALDGSASTFARPLAALPLPGAPPVASAPPVTASAPPVTAGAPAVPGMPAPGVTGTPTPTPTPAVAGSVQAVPAGSAAAPGVAANP